MKMSVSLLIMLFLFELPLFAQSGNNESWQYLGKVTTVYEMRMTEGGRSYTQKTETAFLYGQFNGENMTYKVFVPTSGESYKAHRNANYCKAQIEWNHSGKRIVSFPSLDEMYPYCAGVYHFNPASVYQ